MSEVLRECTLDPRIIEEVERSPQMSREQGNMMSSWGGAETYKAVARMDEPDKVTYLAYLAGFTSSDDIAQVTGLSSSRTDKSIESLGRRGYIPDWKEMVVRVSQG